MANDLRGATGPALAVLVALMAGCGPDADTNAVDPLATDLTPVGMVEKVVIGGVEYAYGCPDFPCPVLDMVKSHVDAGWWMWMPQGAYEQPTIYLYRLSTGIRLRVPVKEADPPPPFLKIDPVLEGPETMMGTRLPDGQLACLQVGLKIVSADGRPWKFLSGERLLTFDDESTLRTGLFKPDWGYLDGDLYGIYPGPGLKGGYDARFLIRVLGEDGRDKALYHSMRCEDPNPPEPPVPPPPPQLTGPEVVRGERLPDKGLVCRDFELEVVSPDEGPWDFVSGRSILTYLRWGWDRQEWIKLDRKRTIKPLGPDKWYQLLHGNYMTVPTEFSTTYYAVFEALVRREVGETVYDHEIEHRFVCVGPDLWDRLYGTPR
jgi:hypothetical protein